MGGSSKKGGGNVRATQFDTNPNSYVNTGYNATPNPFTQQGRPNWMQGNFAMDSWGKSAADPRISLTQDMMNPYGAPIHNQAVQQMGQYDQQMAQFMANQQAGQMGQQMPYQDMMQAPQLPPWMTQAGGGQPMSLDQAMAMNTRTPVIPAAMQQQQSAPKKGKGGVSKFLDPAGILPGGKNAKYMDPLGILPGGENSNKLLEQVGLPAHPTLHSLGM